MEKFVVLSLFLVFVFGCSSSSIKTSKTSNDFSQKKIVTETLYEYGPYTFLRSEFAQNYLLSETDINKISAEMISDRIFFTDTSKNIQKGQMVVASGEEVEIVGKVSIEKVGEFYKIWHAKGTYLLKDTDTTPLKEKEEYLATVNTSISLNSHDNILNEKVQSLDYSKIDFFNHLSEDDRKSKIQFFCEKYPQFKKYAELAKNKKITIGMSEHLLGLSWGKPQQVKEEEVKNNRYRSFIYDGKYQIITKNSVIRSWKKL